MHSHKICRLNGCGDCCSCGEQCSCEAFGKSPRLLEAAEKVEVFYKDA